MLLALPQNVDLPASSPSPLLQHEIVDETDRFVDNLQTQAVGESNPLSPEIQVYLSRSRRRRSFKRQNSGAIAAAAVGAAYAAMRSQRAKERGGT